MQQKITKLFSFFGDIKNEPFYSSCISQLIQIYESSPQSLKLILFNLNQLIFSPCKQIRLRLKHRQICASIISKLNKIYCERVRAFIQNKNSFDIESFQIQEGNSKFQTKNLFGNWQDIDIFKIIETEKLLLATQKGRNQLQAETTLEQDEKKIFDEFVQMKHATMLNMEQLFKDFQQENQVTKKAYDQKRTKYTKKAQKYREKTLEKQIKEVELTISNPFNLMYDICIENMLHSEWELRHLSVLILKELLLHSQFLGFSHSFTMSKTTTVEQRFQQLSSTTKDSLIQHFKSTQKKKKIVDESITSSMILLCLDRFADYQTDQSLIIVRMVAAQILKTCFKTLTPDQQSKLFKTIKRIFDKQSPIHFNTSSGNSYTKVKFTWQVKHSFLYFLTLLTQQSKTCYPLIFKYFEEPFIKMLGNTQVDEVILCICKIFKKFVGEKFFQQKAIDRVNEQIWIIIETLDDISISTKETLSLLGIMFPHFKSNEVVCLERIKKFFVSKIPEVRSQFYNVLSLLYQRNWKIPDKSKLIQQNTIQLLQASIVQHQKQLYHKVCQLAPSILKYTIKDRRIKCIIQFIKNCILQNDLTSLIISKHFKQFDSTIIKEDKIELEENQYLFIYEEDRVGIPSNIYAEKRIWKIGTMLAQALKKNPEGIEQLIRGIEKCLQTNTQKQILILLILDSLIPLHKANKLFVEYLAKAQQILKIQAYSQVLDPQTQRYIKEFDNVINKLNGMLQGNDEFKRLFDVYAKNKLNSVTNGELHAGLLKVIEQTQQQAIKNEVKYLISILINVMENQKDLLKRLKVLAAYFVVKMAEPQQPSGLNNVIKATSQALKQDNFSYISQLSAQSAFLLSRYLYKKKKALYSKLNQNLVSKTQTGYRTQHIKLKEKQNCVNLESTFMQGISLYIEKIGLQIKEWIQEFGELFLKDVGLEQTNDNVLKWNFLTGNIISVLKVDHKATFLDKLIAFLDQLTKNPIFEDEVDENDIQKMVKDILRKTFMFYCTNYTQKSNKFFEWYIGQMKQCKRPYYKTLEVVSQDSLVEVAPICSVFIMRIVKSISIPQVQDLAMNCLSNLIVGVYTNNLKLQLSKELQQFSEEGIEFIKNFKDTSKFNYELKVKLKEDISLRHYQQEGITWLGFLCKYNMNGALCDDMGLGKTLQVLTLVENQYMKLLEQHNPHDHINPSLIIVPTTLVQHWGYQYSKYFQHPMMRILMASHKPQLKQRLPQLINSTIKSPILLITNYNIIEKHYEDFQKYNFKFVILDQGHMIKNVKTKKFKSVKRLRAQHRFILTGTPIQNRLKQLWGLFDFLMPGYLYTEEQFKKHYQKLFQVNLTTFRQDQLMFSQTQKQVLQKLHFKVMPFIMRRLKSQVLTQLPSKIINDYYCHLTEAQQALYKKFEDEQCKSKINFSQEKSVLSVLVEMRKILNHPVELGYAEKYKWEDSGKYLALGELFQQLGFNQDDALVQNKAIIFSRFTTTIDFIEELFLKPNFPNLKYLKLTGNTKIGQRFQIAQTFNGDSDIRVLLVTTAVGGEGLNLSSANVVIMFDHDYNPTVDMQAIDRAHRIGQRRVLNVYRLITKDTLEQRIMGIQKFKTNLANAIVNIDNASIKNIKQSNLPELLQNIRDIQSVNKQVETSINKSIYKQMIDELQKNAIDTNEFNKTY